MRLQSAPAPRGLTPPDTDAVAIDAARFFDSRVICVRCDAAASRTQRAIDGLPARCDAPILFVGGGESYEAHCRDAPGAPSLRPMRLGD